MEIKKNSDETVFKKKLFGDYIEIVVSGPDNPIVREVTHEVYQEGLRLEKIFNFYDKNSELSKLNRIRKLRVSPELMEVIKQGIKFSKLTNGQYDITLGKSIQNRKSFGKTIKIKGSYKDILIKDREVILDSSDILIDLGSIAKGYITDKMIEMLIKMGVTSGLINARGDIRVFGDKEEIISIQHPREEKEMVGNILIKDKAVATSGDYRQYIGTFKRSHIINNKDVIATSVVASSLMLADVYSTILFVLPKKNRENLLNDKNIKALVIDKDLNKHYYNGFDKLTK